MNAPTVYERGPETERLLHRVFTPADAAVAYSLNSDPEVLRYTGDEALESVDHAREFIADYPDFRDVGYGRWACVLRETDAVIGFCGLKYLSDLELVDIGFRFLPQYWGRGLGTEACTGCLRFGFDVIGLSQVVAFAMPDNLASIRVLEKSGMLFDGDYDYDGIPTKRFAAKNPQRAQ